jgi:hypothetical protein
MADSGQFGHLAVPVRGEAACGTPDAETRKIQFDDLLRCNINVLRAEFAL